MLKTYDPEVRDGGRWWGDWLTVNNAMNEQTFQFETSQATRETRPTIMITLSHLQREKKNTMT